MRSETGNVSAADVAGPGSVVSVAVGAAAGLLAGPLVWAGIRRFSRRPWPGGPGRVAAVLVCCGVAGGWAAGWAGGPQVAGAWWVLLVVGVAPAVVDAREHRLPDPLVAAAAVGVFTALGVAAAGGRGWARGGRPSRWPAGCSC